MNTVFLDMPEYAYMINHSVYVLYSILGTSKRQSVPCITPTCTETLPQKRLSFSTSRIRRSRSRLIFSLSLRPSVAVSRPVPKPPPTHLPPSPDGRLARHLGAQATSLLVLALSGGSLCVSLSTGCVFNVGRFIPMLALPSFPVRTTLNMSLVRLLPRYLIVSIYSKGYGML
jgi:hypothetical protein